MRSMTGGAESQRMTASGSASAPPVSALRALTPSPEGEGKRSSQRPEKFGARFSKNAATPSR